MPKNAKKLTAVKGNIAITNFFKPAASVSVTQGPRGGATVSRQSANVPVAPTKTDPAHAPLTSSRKRSRSPEVGVTRANAQCREAPVTPSRQKPKAKGVENQVEGTPNPQQRKKARLTGVSSSTGTPNPIPSSQSDEEELSSSQPATSKAPGLQRAKPVLPPTPDPGDDDDDDAMAVDEDLLDVTQSSFTLTQPAACSPPSNAFSQSREQVLTPPMSDLPSWPPTPAVLDPATKTAQIIARIKAEALAKVMSSPELAPREFNDVLEESDDESFLAPAAFAPKISKAQSTASTSTSNERTIRSSARVQAKKSVSPKREESKRGSTSKVISPPPREKKPKAQKKKAALSPDPFDELLREKRMAEEAGKGEATFARAEEITRLGKASLMDEIFEEDDEMPDFNKMDLFSHAPLRTESSLVLAKGEVDEDFSLDDDIKRDIFGERGDTAIMNIINRDKQSRRERPKEEGVSLRFWPVVEIDQRDASMDVDLATLSVSFPGNHPCIRVLNESVRRNDLQRVQLILQSNILSVLPTIERSAVVQRLCDLALSPDSTTLSDVAMKGLECYWSSQPEQQSDGLKLSSALAAVQRFGASTELLNTQSWPVTEGSPMLIAATEMQRHDLLRRLSTAVSLCSQSNILAEEDVPDLLLCLMLMAGDVTTPPELQRDVIETINLTCSNALADFTSTQFKSNLCTKILRCLRQQGPVNQAHLLTLLSSGADGTRQIATFIAYCLLTGHPANSYAEMPSLLPILDLLAMDETGKSPFAIHENTIYSNLASYVSMLAVAVSDIDAYLAQEDQSQPTKGGDKSSSELDLLCQSLESLHNDIADVRATHLNRTRTKAHIKALSMHIYYCRFVWLRNRKTTKGSLRNYFKKNTA